MTHFPTFQRWFGRAVKRWTPAPSHGVGKEHTVFVPPWKIAPLYQSNSRRLTELSLLQLLSSSLENDYDYSDALLAFAEENRLFKRLAILRLSTITRQSTSLATCFEQMPSLFSSDTIMTLRLGELSDNFLNSVNTLIEEKRTGLSHSILGFKALNFNYFAVLTIAYPLAATYFVNLLYPTFRKMSQEFDIHPQQTLQTLDRWTNLLTLILGYSLPIIPLLFLFFASERFREVLCRLLSKFKFVEFKSVSPISNTKILSTALHLPSPLSTSLAGIAKYHPITDSRHRFLVARNDIELGTAPWSALKDAGIISANDEAILNANSGSSRKDIEAQQYLFDSKLESLQQIQTLRSERNSVLLQTGLVLFFGLLTFSLVYYLFVAITSIPIGLS